MYEFMYVFIYGKWSRQTNKYVFMLYVYVCECECLCVCAVCVRACVCVCVCVFVSRSVEEWLVAGQQLGLYLAISFL